ncbi:MAG: TonB-dependent receptor [Deltaproteobacteria bacterium]|nr:TonB-dependent receptor [Deltaproteobacteria bacterium]
MFASELGPPATVIGSAELRTYGSTFYEVEEALAAREGITFHSAGDVGSEDWILVRGLPRDSSRNVLVLIDGVPLNNAAYEGVEIQDLPSSHLDRVEVWRPPLPARYGGYHAVLAFWTKPLRQQDGVVAWTGAAVGSLATSRTSSGFASRSGPLTIDGSLSTLDTGGLTGRFRTPPFDNIRYGDRSYWDWAPALRVGWQPSARTSFTFTATGSNNRKAFSDDEYRNRWFGLGGFLFAHRFSNQVLLRGAAHMGEERYFLRLRMHPDVSLQQRRRFGGRFEIVVTPTAQSTTVFGVEAGRRVLDVHGHSFALTNAAAFAETRIAPLAALEATAGVRGEQFAPQHVGAARAGRAVLGWSVGLVGHLGPTVDLFTRYGRSNRWPALGEYSERRALNAESLTGGEIGARWSYGDVKVSATFFSLLLGGAIGSDASGTNVNAIEPIRSRGIEARVDARVSAFASLYATWTGSRVTTAAGQATPYGPPPQMASGGAILHDDAWLARVSFRYLGRKEGILRHMGDEGRVADALLVDAYAEHRVTSGVTAWAQIGNLLNLTYETFQGRPMMPRTVLVGVTLDHVL